MMGGGFMGQMHQTNKQNREMLKKHKKDKKKFLNGIDDLKSDTAEETSNELTHEQWSLIRRELEAKKRREKILRRVIPIAAIALAMLLVYFVMYW